MAIRITFDGNNIDINIGENGGLRPAYLNSNNRNEANSGRTETIQFYGREEFEFHASFDEATHDKLIAFWSYARQGNTFAFAFDSTLTGNTTLDGAAAAAQKTIPVTSITGFSDGDRCLIQEAGDDKFEVVTIDGAPSGGNITATDNLYFAYASGDTFRHIKYWPSLILLNPNFKPEQRGATFFYTFQFREQKS